MGKNISAYLFFYLIYIFSFHSAQSQKVIPLYNGVIPNSKPGPDKEISKYDNDSVLIVSRVSRPSLTLFFPPRSKKTSAAVIICPGGGYTNLAMGYEGTDVALRFNQSGIAAFVLKYRIPDTSTMIDKQVGPLQDAQRAILLVRLHAAEWGIDPSRVGIMGFSAGGHLASTAGTHFQRNYIPNPKHISLRPDFMILIYPVISFRKPIAHMGSANNLVGPNPSTESIAEFSNEERVNDRTPPAFLVHAKNDDAVPYENTAWFADSCRRHHVPVKVYYYEKGGHGFGMTNKTSSVLWMDICIGWLEKEHFLRK
jgi:acetyl esterase/lipase